MTAHAMKGDREKCLEAGMDEYVSKPVRTEQLFEAISRVLPPARLQAGDAPPPVPVAAMINWSAAFDTVQGDQELLRLVAEAFLEECPQLVGQLRGAIAARDCPVVRRAAHTVKGSLRTFAADEPIQLAARIEEMGRTESLDAAPETFDTLAKKLDSIMTELTEFVSHSGGTPQP
jgi:HPt (histidine-containing phosphotransfer) domain-containing protein